MSHKDVGPKEQAQRDLAAKKRIEANKNKIDRLSVGAKVKASSVGRVMKNTHVKKIGRRGR
jgi:hypothetical protein